jgi:chromosome segregation ATPase
LEAAHNAENVAPEPMDTAAKASVKMLKQGLKRENKRLKQLREARETGVSRSSQATTIAGEVGELSAPVVVLNRAVDVKSSRNASNNEQLQACEADNMFLALQTAELEEKVAYLKSRAADLQGKIDTQNLKELELLARLEDMSGSIYRAEALAASARTRTLVLVGTLVEHFAAAEVTSDVLLGSFAELKMLARNLMLEVHGLAAPQSAGALPSHTYCES